MHNNFWNKTNALVKLQKVVFQFMKHATSSMIRVSGCLLLLKPLPNQIPLYCAGELVKICSSPYYLNANQTCVVCL